MADKEFSNGVSRMRQSRGELLDTFHRRQNSRSLVWFVPIKSRENLFGKPPRFANWRTQRGFLFVRVCDSYKVVNEIKNYFIAISSR